MIIRRTMMTKMVYTVMIMVVIITIMIKMILMVIMRLMNMNTRLINMLQVWLLGCFCLLLLPLMEYSCILRTVLAKR